MSQSDDGIYCERVDSSPATGAGCADESIGEYGMLPKCERIEETLVVGEEIVVDENMDINQRLLTESVHEEKPAIEMSYFEEIVPNPEDTYREPSSLLPPDDKASQEEQTWISEGAETHSLMGGGLLKVEQLPETEESEGCTELLTEDPDEETIATFVTAAGQQLALYAVEDSEEIFAVAVYDESGEPPTNFQFLMKADVERLIGEGAVRTVKKPTQIKKQLLTTQPPMFFKNDPVHQVVEERTTPQKEQRMQERLDLPQEGLTLNGRQSSDVIYTSEHKDLAYLMVNDINIDQSEGYDQSEDERTKELEMMFNQSDHNDDEPEQEEQESESETEFVEQSTVQYILLENEQTSDTELTFDEIQATLQNLKYRKSYKRSPSKPASQDQITKQRSPAREEPPKTTTPTFTVPSVSSATTANSLYNSRLAEKKLNAFLESRKELIETLSDHPAETMQEVAKQSLANGSLERVSSPGTVQVPLIRAKRSRKQQLVSVNRDDSEIIIQPASLMSEEENNVRKRGKRKRRIPRPGYRQQAKRVRKKRKEVEIIELDADEEESSQSRRDVVEITIDDSKDKYSSDKENEIIMVGDLEDQDEEQEEPDLRLSSAVLRCEHCSRNFRQQRALETHLRVCSKSPSNAVKFEPKLKQPNRSKEPSVKKQYPCKICQEKFDVVVALARHVRSAHSQRKRRRYSKSSAEPETEPGAETPTSQAELKAVEEASEKEDEKKRRIVAIEASKQLRTIDRIKRRKTRAASRPSRSWEGRKLSCADCGRWFPSSALLAAHSLQHGTRKSEHQFRRCHVCKKLLKSRLLYTQHLKKHATVSQQSSKSVGKGMQKKLHTTRSVTRKITSLRKRGRARKL